MMRLQLKNEKGLTLIELLAVIIILGIIAAIAVPAIGNIIENTKIRAVMADIESIESASWYYYLDTGEFPKSSVSGPGLVKWHKDSLKLFVNGDSDELPANWGGPYLTDWPIPPFSDSTGENVYAYRYVEEDSWYNANMHYLHNAKEVNTDDFSFAGAEFVNVRFNDRRYRDEYGQYFVDRFGENKVFVTDGDEYNDKFIWVMIRHNRL